MGGCCRKWGLWSWWLRRVTARSLPTPSFAAKFPHVGVKCKENLCAKLVLGNVCGGVATVCISVALDLQLMTYLLPLVVRLAFQGESGKDVAPFFARTQFPVRVHLGVVDQASLLFLLFLSSAALCVVGRLGTLALHAIEDGSGWRNLLMRADQRRVLKFTRVLSTWPRSAALRHISIQQNICKSIA